MSDERSDDELRRVAYGRGASPSEAVGAARELERRRSEASTATVESVVDGASASSASARSRGALVVTAVAVLALSGGWIARGVVDDLAPRVDASTVDTIAPTTGSAAPGPGTIAGGELPGTPRRVPVSVTDPGTGRVVYTVPGEEGRAPDGDPDRAFPIAQAGQLDLPAVYEDVDPATAHYLGRIGDVHGAWTARSSTGDYCVVIAINDLGSYVPACVTESEFRTRGVSVTSGRYTLLWNGDSAIFSMTSD